MSRFQSLQLQVRHSVRAIRLNDSARSFLVAFAVIAAVVAASCDKVPLTSPTGSTILLSASSNIVPIDGSAEITATVTESAGTAVQNGTTVVFRADLGRMDPQESQTVNGRAVSRFFASGLSGVARINAFSGAAATGGSTPVNSSAPAPGGPLTILVGGAAASRITLRAEPPNIPQAGGTVQIIANVADTNGSPVQGAPVTFAIGGTGTGTGILGSPSTQTNANGVAQTSLTTNQTTTVTATVATAGSTSAVTANVVVTALTAPTITSLICALPLTGFSVGVAVNCTITLPTTATTPIQNVTVNWGDGTGEQPVGNVTGATTVSHTYSTPGTYTVTVSATDLNGQRGTAVASLTVNRVLPNVVLTVPTTGTTGVAVAMSIAPASTQAQPITGVVVTFGDGTTRTFGSLSSAQGFTKTYASEGGYTVTATATDASGQQGSTSAAIVISRGAAPTASLTVPGTLTRNVAATFTVTATAALGGPPISSVVVTMTDGTVLYSRSAGGQFVYTFMGSGATTLTTRVTDTAGNVGQHQVAVSINP